MVRYIKEGIEDEFDKFDFGDENAEWYHAPEVPRECIKGATLLSKEEYEKYNKGFQSISDWWWLRTPGYFSDIACTVDSFGLISSGYYATNVQGNYGVRPSLTLDLEKLNLAMGDKIEFGGHLFTIISNDLAICDDLICDSCFRKDNEAPGANLYERSDVKKVVDKWFNDAMRNYK